MLSRLSGEVSLHDRPGTIPPANSRAGKDAMELLRTLAPRNSTPSKEITDASCKMLHLAFKGQTSEDIYDTLVFCFVKAARQYDPYYTDKTKQVCEVIGVLPKQFTVEQLEARVGFDCNGILRSLVRKKVTCLTLVAMLAVTEADTMIRFKRMLKGTV